MRVDEQGEVLARSNHVFEGYWEQPEATAEALVDGWFHTGDGGELDGAYVVISDRKKDVIICGGENVSSIEVEDCLFQHPAVAEVAVIGVPDDKWGETVKALVVLRPGHDDVDEAELIAYCRERDRALQVPDLDRVPRRARPHRHRQAPEVQAPRPLLGRPGRARSTSRRQGDALRRHVQTSRRGPAPAAVRRRRQRWSIATLIAPLASWSASAVNASRHSSSRNVWVSMPVRSTRPDSTRSR